MRKHVLLLTTTAAILTCGAIAASAQGPGTQPTPAGPMMLQQDQDDYHRYHGGMMGGGMMGGGMMGGGMMGGGMMGQGCGRGMMGSMAMRIIFSLMDADGDGTVSLQEFQAAHERIFKAMDATTMAPLASRKCRLSCAGTKFADEMREEHRRRAMDE